jgi:hypothetical protein
MEKNQLLKRLSNYGEASQEGFKIGVRTKDEPKIVWINSDSHQPNNMSPTCQANNFIYPLIGKLYLFPMN